MKTVLISGCSYGLIFNDVSMQEHIKKELKVEKIINLSYAGSSVERQIKTVIEWLSNNPFPDLIIMPLTHIERYDESVSKIFDPAVAYDESLCVSMDPFTDNQAMNKQLKSRIDLQTINSLLKNKTLIYNHTSAFNKFISHIITFSGWLQNKKIRHLLFNMSNQFDKTKFLKINKQIFLQENKNIIDIFSFCGNKFMYDSLNKEEQINEKINELGQYAHHYGVESNKLLINHLNSYIIKHNI